MSRRPHGPTVQDSSGNPPSTLPDDADTVRPPHGEEPTAADGHTYTAFGLTVRSEVAIPEFRPYDLPPGATADATIRRGAVELPAGLRELDRRYGPFSAGPGDLYLRYGVGDVHLRDGRAVVVDAVADVDPELLRWFLVGSVFNHLLYQRGYLVIHASIVQVGDRAVCFLGESHAGKSTTAMAHFEAGHRVVADDIAAVAFDGDDVFVQPGFPAIKLDETLVPGLDLPLEPLPEQSPDHDRHFYRIGGDHPVDPIPLAAMYVLADGPSTVIRPMSAGEALMALIENTYTDVDIDGMESVGTNMADCARAVRSVPVKTLQRERVLHELPTVVERVVSDVAVARC